MALSPFIKATHLEQAQGDQELILNGSLDKSDASNNDFNDIDVSGGGTIVVSAIDYESNFVQRLHTNPAGAFTLEVPDGGRVFAVDNDTSESCTVQTATVGTTVTVLAGATKIIYSKGVDLIELSA